MKKVIDNYRIIAKNFAFISSLEKLLFKYDIKYENRVREFKYI